MMNDILDRIRRKEAQNNEILKHAGYDWLKNSDDLSDRERDRLMSVKSDLQRLWQVNASIAESYLKKWISWASGSRMPDIIKLGKTMERHIEGILEAIRSGINSAVAKGLNNNIRTAFKRSYGFKAWKYRDTIIYLVAGGLKLPHNVKEFHELQLLLNACKNITAKALISLLWDSGVRASELLLLKVKDFQLSKDKLYATLNIDIGSKNYKIVVLC